MTFYDGKPIFVHMTIRMRDQLAQVCELEDIPLSAFVRWAIRERIRTYDLGAKNDPLTSQEIPPK